MYQLYIDRKNYKLKVEKIQKQFQNYGPLIAFAHTGKEDDIFCYNENYRMCKNRKVLVQLAREIKDLWLLEVTEQAQKIEEIKI
jgi:hypothetical protein